MSTDVPDHYWKNLLALTTGASAEAASQNASFEPRVMSDDNREWLEKVMSDLVKETDPGKQLDSVMHSLHTYAGDVSNLNSEDVPKVEDLGYRLQDLLLFADLVPTFVSNGGLLMIEKFITDSQNEQLRTIFAEAVMTMAENNPPAQQLIVDSGFLEKLLTFVKDDKLPKMLRLKILGAISTAVRSHEPAFESFLSLSGPSIFSSLFSTDLGEISAKAARVLTSIAFTMQDSVKYSKLLSNDIARGYIHLAHFDSPEAHVGEMEYILDFLNQYVSPEDLADPVRNALITSLARQELELPNPNPLIETLSRKYKALRSG